MRLFAATVIALHFSLLCRIDDNVNTGKGRSFPSSYFSDSFCGVMANWSFQVHLFEACSISSF